MSSVRIATALAYMQANRGDALTVESIADEVAMSPFHFARLFTAAMGVSPIAYLRKLRLEQASDQLRSSDKPLIEVALDAGFESQQTFTRAFTRMFGHSPGNHRKHAMMPNQSSENHSLNQAVDVQMDADLLDLGPLRLAGCVVGIDGLNGLTPRSAWLGLDPGLPIKGQVPGRSFGVCWPDIESESFDYMAAVELKGNARVPKGLTLRQVPAQRYAVFRQHFGIAEFEAHFRAGLEQIWGTHLTGSGLTPSGGPDLEVYDDELIVGITEGWLTRWIPVL